MLLWFGHGCTGRSTVWSRSSAERPKTMKKHKKQKNKIARRLVRVPPTTTLLRCSAQKKSRIFGPACKTQKSPTNHHRKLFTRKSATNIIVTRLIKQRRVVMVSIMRFTVPTGAIRKTSKANWCAARNPKASM